MSMVIDNLKYNKMFEEYRKGGKFSDFVNKAMRSYGTTLQQELRKVITYEYYKSVTTGCNQK